jgi:hypothetical protein
VSAGRGRRRGPRGTRDAVGQALDAWREHSRDCWTCHSNAGHPAFYCTRGWQLAGDVSRARAEARLRAEIARRQQGTLL